MTPTVFLSIVLVKLVLVCLVKGHVELPIPNEALDQNLYEDVIDPELCDEQISLIRNSTFLTMFFADAGIRVPRGILEGNTIDMGNYHQCIGFNQPTESSSELQGKYCMIRVPMNQSFDFPDLPFKTLNFNPNLLHLDGDTRRSLEEFNAMRKRINAMAGVVNNDRILTDNPLSELSFRLAICIPKPCTTEQAINSFLFNISSMGFQYTDDFCRLPDDKPWVPGDTVAVVVFSLIGLITVVSTSFDVWQIIILKKDPKTVSVIGRLFSMYTNGRRIMTFQSGANSLECLDGIRALAMIWVVLGHSFSTEHYAVNPLGVFLWISSWQAVWITSATLTVDTFFMLSGFLLVYTNLGKLNAMQLLKNIHLFWLNRLLRMFPLLAAAVLLEATYLNRMSDGPMWLNVVNGHVNTCRSSWWSTLLHVQNYVNPMTTCLAQTWYLAIDVQLHVLSPIILFWVLLGKKRIAWTALLSGLVAILAASSAYIFHKGFRSTVTGEPEQIADYTANYYMNTLTRGSPFLVGMIFGYIVKTKPLVMSRITTACYWIVAISLLTFCMYSRYPVEQPDWDNQTGNNLYNSFIRPLWALYLGIMVYACVYGYGGPIDWILSLKVWKLPARMAYGIFVFHLGLMGVVNMSAVAPFFFSMEAIVFKFLGHYTLAFAVTFLMALVIDAPFTTIFNLLLKSPKKQVKKETEEAPTKEIEKRV